MDGDSPEPQSFDPAQSESPQLPDAVSGGLVLVVSASGTADPAWAEQSAIALATGWARQGHRILLADLSLVRPGLHRVLGVENLEGVSDTVLFGSSLQKVAQPVREHGFLFVPAGTATARPDVVTGSPRWASVVDGCARVQATLVAFLPSDLPGGEALLERASDVVLLTEASAEGGAALQAGLGDRLLAVLVPPGRADALTETSAQDLGARSPFADAAWSEPAVAKEPAGTTLEDAQAALTLADEPAPGPLEPEESSIAGLGDDLVIGVEDAAVDAGTPTDVLGGMDMEFGLDQLEQPEEETPQFGGELSFLEPEAEPERAPEPEARPSWSQPAVAARPSGHELRSDDLPMRDASAEDARGRPGPRVAPERPAAKAEAPKRSRAGALMLLLLAVAAGVVGATWYGVLDIPWLSGVLPARAAATAGAQPANAPAVPLPVAAPINEFAWALTLDSFTDPAPPKLQAASLNQQRPDLLFVVAPVSVDGAVYYRLLAGPAADSAAAEELRATLKTVLTREDGSKWVRRPTPLAFNLGDRDDLASAAERVAELSRVDIPAFVLELPGRTAAGVRIHRYRVYGGAYADEQEATYMQDLLVKKGFPDARLVQIIGRHPQ